MAEAERELRVEGGRRSDVTGGVVEWNGESKRMRIAADSVHAKRCAAHTDWRHFIEQSYHTILPFLLSFVRFEQTNSGLLSPISVILSVIAIAGTRDGRA